MSVEYNLFDPAVVDNDAAILRSCGRPVRWGGGDARRFLRVHHADILAVSTDTATFPQAPFSPMEEDTRTPDQLQVGESNPPLHTQIHKLLASVLRPSRIRAMESVVDKACRDLVWSTFARKGFGDLIREIARPLPEIVVASA